MNNKIIIAAACLALGGCASMKYPNWEKVEQLETAYKKPCKETGEDKCDLGNCEDNTAWFQKRATKYNANNFMVEYAENAGSIKDIKYFFCGPGVPINMNKSGIAATIRNRLKPAITEEDIRQDSTECSYDAHKATVDTSRKLLERIYIPTNNFYYNMAAFDARASDRMNEMTHDLHLSNERSSIYNECMGVKGYVYKRSSDAEALAEVEKYCPDIDTVTKACFIPGKAK